MLVVSEECGARAKTTQQYAMPVGTKRGGVRVVVCQLQDVQVPQAEGRSEDTDTRAKEATCGRVSGTTAQVVKTRQSSSTRSEYEAKEGRE